MKSLITILAIASLCLQSIAQVPVELKFNHKLQSNTFAFNESSTNNLNEQFTVTRLEYYISKISVTHDNGQVTEVKDVYALINPSNTQNVDLGELNISSVEAINFSVGVDPGVNNEDPTQWPMSHPLAPKSPSMHWGWSAGYRFVALEGKCGNDLNLELGIHALGNKNYFDLSIPTSSKDVNGTLVIELNADYSKALKGLSIASGLVNHGEDLEAKDLLINFRNEVFSSLNGDKNTLSTEDFTRASVTNLNAFPNPTTGSVTVQINNISYENITYDVVDITGKVITQNVAITENNTTIIIDETGVYFISIYQNNVPIATKRILKI